MVANVLPWKQNSDWNPLQSSLEVNVIDLIYTEAAKKIIIESTFYYLHVMDNYVLNTNIGKPIHIYFIQWQTIFR